MPSHRTCHVVDSDPLERAWIESALAGSAGRVEFVADGWGLLACPPPGNGNCVLAFADGDAGATLHLVRELRAAGIAWPVIVIGPHSAFRTAVGIARLPDTDFIERPVSAFLLRSAMRRALGPDRPT